MRTPHRLLLTFIAVLMATSAQAEVVEFKILIDLPRNVSGLAKAVGVDFLNKSNPANGWPGLEDFVGRLNFLVLGLILVLMMLLRPQGILPSRVREQELRGDSDESERENEVVADLRARGE